MRYSVGAAELRRLMPESVLGAVQSAAGRTILRMLSDHLL